MNSTLRTLLDRVEKGEGADFELDCRLAWTFGLEPWAGRPEDHVGLCMPRSKIAQATPALTSSIDAAVALVEKVLPGHDHEVFRDRDAKLVTVDLTKPIGGGASSGYLGQHAEEPRATLLALLRAKIAQEEGA